MITQELEQLLKKESHKILVVNGTPRRVANLGERLREEGYSVEEAELRLPSVEEFKRHEKDDQVRITKNIDEEIQQLIQKYPNCLIANYEAKNQGILVFSRAEFHAINQQKEVKITAVLDDKSDKLRESISVGRATRLYIHNLESFVRDFQKANCDPRLTISQGCQRIGALLQNLSTQTLDDSYFEMLNKSIVTQTNA